MGFFMCPLFMRPFMHITDALTGRAVAAVPGNNGLQAVLALRIAKGRAVRPAPGLNAAAQAVHDIGAESIEQLLVIHEVWDEAARANIL